MQGIKIRGVGRPRSKKQVKEEIATDPSRVFAEGTSLHGGEYDGPISEMPEGTKVNFVGPDPYTNRKFYGTIVKDQSGNIKVS